MRMVLKVNQEPPPFKLTRARHMKRTMVRPLVTFLLICGLDLLLAACPSLAGGTVVGWGGPPPPAGLTNVVAIASGYAHGLVLNEDGTVVAWGSYLLPDWGPAGPWIPVTVPSGLGNVVAVASGMAHSLALKADGTVVAWGTNTDGQLNVPAGLSNVVAVGAGTRHSLALKTDGTVVAWGSNSYGQNDMPIGLTNVCAIAAGWVNSLALKADGSVIGWGITGGSNPTELPTGLTKVEAIAAGDDNVVLQADGTVIGWGLGGYAVPADLTNVVAIAAGLGGPDNQIDLALKADGTVTGWGFLFGPPLVPPDLSNVVAIAAGGYGSLALVGDAPPARQVLLSDYTWSPNGFNISLRTQRGRVYRLEFKNSLEDSQWAALPLVAGDGGAQPLNDPTGTAAAQRFYRVRRW